MTTRIDARFAELKQQGRSAFVTFVMAGDPDPKTSLDILKAPMRVTGTTSHIADWLLYFTGSDRAALSASRDEVSKIKVPVAMIWGDRDDVTPLAQANDLRALIPQASLKVMQDVGHIPQIEDPAAFNAALIDAIRQLASADPAVAHAGRN